MELLGIECGFILAQAFRLFLVAAALRFDVSYAQATTLAIATSPRPPSASCHRVSVLAKASPRCSRPSLEFPRRSDS